MKKSYPKSTIIQLSFMFILIIFLLCLIFKLLIILSGGGILFLLFTPKPPQPEITYGEFPFKLIYSINGKPIIVEDTIICEYDGFIVGSNGAYRQWKTYLDKDGEESVLILNDSRRKIYCYVGDAEYYMNDEKYPEKRPLTPRIYDVKLDKMDTTTLNPEQLRNLYDIKLISWDFSEPITNSFK